LRRNADIVACLSAVEQAQFDHLLDRLVAHALASSPLATSCEPISSD
jgi:hypothetical protein